MPKTVPYRSLRRQPGPWRGNRLGQRWLGLVVRPRIALRRRNGGFSFIVIFLLVLSILTTTLALTSRTTGGLYAQSYQSKLRLAKDAAENGLVVVASEFNYPGNRLAIGGGGGFGIKVGSQDSFAALNLKGVADDSDLWGSNEIPDSGGQDVDYPCYTYFRAGAIRQNVSDGSANIEEPIIYQPSVVPNSTNGQYDGTGMTTWFNSIAQDKNNFHYLGNGQLYRPIALRLYNDDHTKNSSFDSSRRSPNPNEYAKAANNSVSYLTVAVEGFYAPRQTLNNKRGDIIAYASVPDDKNSVKYTLQQEFQVVPRCCSQGFGKVNRTIYGPSSADSSHCTATTANTRTEWILRSVSRTSAFNSDP
jgi:hypothetical protein